MQLFDGNYQGSLLDQQIKKHIQSFPCRNRLGIVQIGDNSSSTKYVFLKKKKCEELGIECLVFKYDSELSMEELKSHVEIIAKDPYISGFIIQLPLPLGKYDFLIKLIPSEKDIDNLTNSLTFDSPVVRALGYFLDWGKISLKNNEVCVIGDGNLVGKPLAKYCEKKGAGVTVNTNYKTGDKITADLIIVGVGIPGLVKGEDVKQGANVVDFGSAVVEGRVMGDFDVASHLSHLGIISPSPGGLGPLVVRYLIMNFLGI